MKREVKTIKLTSLSEKEETENEGKSFLGFALRDNEKRKNYLFLVKSLVIVLFKNDPIFPVFEGSKIFKDC